MFLFQDILEDLIEEKGLSLRKLALESNVSASQYAKYLKGIIPSIEVSIRIANYFKCSLDYLFGLNNNNNYSKKLEINLDNFVNKYENILKESKLTHWKFAKKVNLSESCLRHWKYGQIPKMESIILIAKNLPTSIDFLITK